MQSKGEAVLVIGAGVAGIRAALDLAEMGCKVYLVDKSPNVGGTLVQLDKWFPDNHCGMCKMLPIFSRDDSSQFCLRRGLIHPNIEILPLTEVERVEGQAGDFTVSLKTVPKGVNQDLCIGCGLCVEVCPVEVPNDFNEGLVTRKAVYLRNPWMPSSSYVIDWETCTKCGACVNKCPTKAIDLGQKQSDAQLKVGSVILSTGFEEFDPALTSQYGHRRFPNVVTSIELERLLSPGGPTKGELLRPSDQKLPKSVAFLQCVGSRDTKRNYCSYACCMYALKEAMLIKKAHPEMDVEIFYMDMRTFGKGYYRYFMQAEDMGIKFTRSRVPVVKQDFRTRDLLITVAAEDGGLSQRRVGMVVLSVGQTPSPRFKELGTAMGLKLNEWNFCEAGEFTPVETNKPGIYVCGSASGPKDIADSLVEATAAAGEASLFVSRREPVEATQQAKPVEGGPKTAVFLCACGEEVASKIHMDSLAEACKSLPSVVHVEESPYLCQKDVLKGLGAKMRKHGADRVVLGTCAPFLSKRLSSVIEVDPSLALVVSLREEVAWSNRDNIQTATNKAKALMRMAVERIRLQETSSMAGVSARQSALVIGGGVAGMVSALGIADQGFEVHLMDRDVELGGNARDIYYTIDGDDVQAFLKDLIQKVENNPRVHVYKESEVTGLTGYVGNFDVKFVGKEGTSSSLEVGSIVVATGGDAYKPSEYLYGQNDKVINQEEFEKRLVDGQLGDVKSVAMIQCVGARDDARPYCSRICCSQALKNALRLKRARPDAQVIVFYRDLMSYGFMERYYTQAREKGVLFVRYDLKNKPEVKSEGAKLKIEAIEPVLRGKIVVEPDLLVLSTPILPRDQTRLAKLLEVEFTEDGFFKEAEVKFRPVDFLRDGIFLCGLAHSPRGIGESIAQAQAAAQRAASILARGQLRSGRMVSEVKERWCAGCEMCIQVCPFSARVKDEEAGVVLVREALCQGCGACVVACPSGAAWLRGLSDKQVISMMDAAF